MICYRKATLEDLERIWDYHIRMDPEEPRNQRWKESYISRNVHNRAATYVAVSDGEPVGEVTLDYHAEAYGNPEVRVRLADGVNCAYVTALRIRKEFEGKGYCSALMRYMEDAAGQAGFQSLSIGVEAAQTRNLGIYLHWGYDEFILGETDGTDLILFYRKELKKYRDTGEKKV